MVKYLDHPEPGEHTEPSDIQGRGHHFSGPEGTPTRVSPEGKELRRWPHVSASVRLNALNRSAAGDVRRRAGADIYPARLSEETNAVEPRNDISAAHCAPEAPADAVPDDAPLTER